MRLKKINPIISFVYSIYFYCLLFFILSTALHFNYRLWREFVDWPILSAVMAVLTILYFFHPQRWQFVKWIKTRPWTTWLKGIIIIFILALALWMNVEIINFWLIFYAANAILFAKYRRVTTLMGIGFLIITAIFYSIEVTDYAHYFAIYAYYFLTISLLILIMENISKKDFTRF